MILKKTFKMFFFELVLESESFQAQSTSPTRNSNKMVCSIAKCLEWNKLTYCRSRKMTTWSAEIWSLKAIVGRISACVWLCKFSASIVLYWLLCVSFISIMKLIMEQTIIVRALVFIYLFIYLFIYFQWISLMLFIENDSTSVECKFLAKFLLMLHHSCT